LLFQPFFRWDVEIWDVEIWDVEIWDVEILNWLEASS